MTRVFLCITCLVIVSLEALGQCVNGPTVTLQSTTASTCGLLPVILTGNTFGGSATLVTITGNGKGSLTPGSASASPFSFTYTPASSDLGKQITITVTTNNPNGPPCIAAKATCTISVYTNPTAPVVGTITNPTCQVSTGSVVLKCVYLDCIEWCLSCSHRYNKYSGPWSCISNTDNTKYGWEE